MHLRDFETIAKVNPENGALPASRRDHGSWGTRLRSKVRWRC